MIMLTGVAGMFIPRRGSGWLRRRIVVRWPRGTAVDPASGPRALGIGRVLHQPPGRGTPVARPQPPVTAGAAEPPVPSTRNWRAKSRRSRVARQQWTR
jgi:hypothetical protein